MREIRNVYYDMTSCITGAVELSVASFPMAAVFSVRGLCSVWTSLPNICIVAN